MPPYKGTRPGWTAIGAIVTFCFFAFLDVKDARPDLISALKSWALHIIGLRP